MIDKVEIVARGGRGGNGAISFRREKFVPFGGPDGGNGGKGGDVLILADPSETDLRRFKPKGIYRGEDGGQGKGNNKHGKNGKDLLIGVPMGTVVSLQGGEGTALVADLEHAGDSAVVARGGRGGSGNTRFVSSTNQAPQIAQKGEDGEEQEITLEMRLIADVGIIGYPNAGKSTLLAAASAAKPKIASYPFTTLEPVLGAVEVGKKSFTLAEIPGLIGGAHLGRGLGHDFLRHAMRTRVFIHLIDASSASPAEDMVNVNSELALYDPALATRPQIVALNKIDIPEVEARLSQMVTEFEQANIHPVSISAATGQGVAALMERAVAMLERLGGLQRERQDEGKVFHPRPPRPPVSVRKEGEIFVVSASELERIITRGGASGTEVRWQLRRQLARMGVNKALEKAGVKTGDKVRCGSLEWEW